MNMTTIRGKLTPANAEVAACPFVRVRLYWSFTQNGLRELVTFGTTWDESGISFNNVTLTAATVQDVEKFVTNLTEIMKTEDAVRLSLTGAFTVEIETNDNRQVFNITVTAGEVTYKEVFQVQDETAAA